MLSLAIKKFHLLCIMAAVVLYTITAIHSKGYYHPDEHYQVYEFGTYKAGLTYKEHLAWEFRARVRPAIQPAMVYGAIKVLHLAGISDIVHLPMAFRILTGLLLTSVISFFVRVNLVYVRVDYHKPFILLSYFLWFLPFINVRFTSETWSMLFFLLAISYWQKGSVNKQQVYWITGFLLGCSFLFRYQSALLTASFAAWLLFVKKEPFRQVMPLLPGFVFMVVAGMQLDAWFYETTAITWWNYFYNIIMSGASGFGVSPSYFYFTEITRQATYPVGILLMLAFSRLMMKRWKNLYVWLTFSFIAIHSLIPHKELRFLFPLANFAPIILILAWQTLREQWRPPARLKAVFKIAARAIAGVAICMNITGLAVVARKPAGNTTKAITSFIHRHYSDQPVNLIHHSSTNPYDPWYWGPLREHIYRDRNVHFINLLDAVPERLKATNRVNVLVIKPVHRNNPAVREVINVLQLKEVKRSIPVWICWLLQFYDNSGGHTLLLVYADR